MVGEQVPAAQLVGLHMTAVVADADDRKGVRNAVGVFRILGIGGKGRIEAPQVGKQGMIEPGEQPIPVHEFGNVGGRRHDVVLPAGADGGEHLFIGVEHIDDHPAIVVPLKLGDHFGRDVFKPDVYVQHAFARNSRPRHQRSQQPRHYPPVKHAHGDFPRPTSKLPTPPKGFPVVCIQSIAFSWDFPVKKRTFSTGTPAYSPCSPPSSTAAG